MHHEAHAVDAHRRHRGAYTAAATLLKELLAPAFAKAPELVRAHELTLLSVLPELADFVPLSPDVVLALPFAREGNAPAWTLRIAHGLVEFLVGYARLGDALPLTLTFTNVEHADATDREFIALLAMRAPPDVLAIVIGP